LDNVGSIVSDHGFEAHFDAEPSQFIRDVQRIAVRSAAQEQLRADSDRFGSGRFAGGTYSTHGYQSKRIFNELRKRGPVEDASREIDCQAIGRGGYTTPLELAG
jgi:hypothetical protein